MNLRNKYCLTTRLQTNEGVDSVGHFRLYNIDNLYIISPIEQLLFICTTTCYLDYNRRVKINFCVRVLILTFLG